MSSDQEIRSLLRAFQADPQGYAVEVVANPRVGLCPEGARALPAAESWVFDRQVRSALRHVQGLRQARIVETKRVAAQMHLWFNQHESCRLCRSWLTFDDPAWRPLDSLERADRVECPQCHGSGQVPKPPKPGDRNRFHGGKAPRKCPAESRSTVISMLAITKTSGDQVQQVGTYSVYLEVNEGPGWEPFSENLLWNPDPGRVAVARFDAARVWAAREAVRTPEPGELFKLSNM